MSWEAWYTLAVVLGLLGVLITERISASTAVLGGVLALLFARVVNVHEAFSGFSNPAPITIAALYVLAHAVDTTGALAPFVARAMGASRRETRVLARTMVASAGISAFMYNTPIVAVVSPEIIQWSRRSRLPPSRFLLPMCYAVSLGGLLTVLGSSINAVVSGLLEESGQHPIATFELTKVGGPIVVLGVLALLASARFLPKRPDVGEALSEAAREFTVETIVAHDGPLVGRSIADAGLRNLEGVFLVQIERDGRLITPVEPTETLSSGDRLIFAGNVGNVLDLHRLRGLESVAQQRGLAIAQGRRGPGPRLYEAVIGPSSPLTGQTLKGAGFRGRYGGVVIAIHRPGDEIREKLGGVRLHAGDVLLVLADVDFRARWYDRHDFLVISPLEGGAPPGTRKAPIVGLITLALIVLTATGRVSVVEGALGAAALLVIAGVLTAAEARESVDINILLIVAGSFGIAAAIAKSGLADEIAKLFVSGLGRFGDVGIMAGVLVATTLVTQVISNSATAATMFPIGIATAHQAHLSPRAFAIAVLIGASASFLTPIGYDTNMMVYGLGGYRFGDFGRFGFALTIVTVALAIVFIPIGWPLRG
jgi:di/tricarboxylate transporter